MEKEITLEEFSKREAARWKAEETAQKTKKSKVVKELVDLGLSEDSAKILLGLPTKDKDK
jgi:hypothetical protein